MTGSKLAVAVYLPYGHQRRSSQRKCACGGGGSDGSGEDESQVRSGFKIHLIDFSTSNKQSTKLSASSKTPELNAESEWRLIQAKQ